MLKVYQYVKTVGKSMLKGNFFKKETQRRFRSSKASNQLLSPWTPLIPSLILSETSLRIASVSLSVATNQIAKVLFCFEIY